MRNAEKFSRPRKKKSKRGASMLARFRVWVPMLPVVLHDLAFARAQSGASKGKRSDKYTGTCGRRPFERELAIEYLVGQSESSSLLEPAMTMLPRVYRNAIPRNHVTPNVHQKILRRSPTSRPRNKFLNKAKFFVSRSNDVKKATVQFCFCKNSWKILKHFSRA